MPIMTCALGPDAAGTVLTSRLASAVGRLDIAVYELGPTYAALVARAHRSGVRVRVILDRHAGANSGGGAILTRAGVPCRVLGGRWGAEAHWKMLVADRWVAVGTGNLIRRDAPADPKGRVPPDPVEAGPGTREWWTVVDDDPAVAAAASAGFDAAWREASPWQPVTKDAVDHAPAIGVPEPLIAPRTVRVGESAVRLWLGGAAIGGELDRLLRQAKRRALVLVPYVHPGAPAVARLLTGMSEAAAAGVDARLLLGLVPPGGGASIASWNVAARVMNPLRCTTGHAKGAVIDDVAVVGSANWSAAGLGANREAAIVARASDVADYFAAAFEHDWATASHAS